jgi:hypothetical protein
MQIMANQDGILIAVQPVQGFNGIFDLVYGFKGNSFSDSPEAVPDEKLPAITGQNFFGSMRFGSQNTECRKSSF